MSDRGRVMADGEDTHFEDPRFSAALKLIGRTGAEEFVIRFDEPEDDERGQPTVWIALAKYARDGRDHWMVGAALHPLRAVFSLCDSVVDGGTCVHCRRPTGFAETHESMPLEDRVCWYQWVPEMKTFRRGCEGPVEGSEP